MAEILKFRGYISIVICTFNYREKFYKPIENFIIFVNVIYFIFRRSVSLYIFYKTRYSHSTIKSYHFCLPSTSTSSKNPQMEQVVSVGTIGFSFTKICFLMSFNSKNFGFIVFENQLFRVSIVNFSSTENSLTRELDFFCANIAEAASLS